jgi:hypothetical protein
MRIIILGKTRYTVRDDRTDIMAAHAKCTGKHKLVSLMGQRSAYILYGVDMSTAEYVAAYEKSEHQNYALGLAAHCAPSHAWPQWAED